MGSHITVILGNGQTHDFELSDTDLAQSDSAKAHEWLDREFELAGCVPTNPVGKLVLADKVMLLAKTQPEAVFAQPTPWVREFLRAAAVTIRRPLITIDLSNRTLGY